MIHLKKKSKNKYYDTSNIYTFYDLQVKEQKKQINNISMKKQSEVLSVANSSIKNQQIIKWDNFMEYTNAILKRRKSVFKEYVSKMVEESTYAEKEEEKELVKQSFATLLATPTKTGFNALDGPEGKIVSTAAIWILEQLFKDNKLEALFPYLEPTDNEDEPNHYYTHPFLSNELIVATTNLICNKDGEKYRNYSFGNVYHEVSKKDKNSINPYREKWESLLSLLGEDFINDAVDYFKEKSWYIFKIETALLYNLFEKQLKYKEAVHEFGKEDIDRLWAFLEKHNPTTAKILREKANVTFKQANSKQKAEIFTSLINACHMIDKDYVENSVGTFIPYDNKENEIDEIIKNLSYIYVSNKSDARNFINENKKHFPEELVSSYNEFKVEDFGKIAFAILYLLYTDDYFVWLYPGSLSVLNQASYNSTQSFLPIALNCFEINNENNLYPNLNNPIYSYEKLIEHTENNALFEKTMLSSIKESKLMSSPLMKEKQSLLQILNGFGDCYGGNLTFSVDDCKEYIEKTFDLQSEREKECVLFILQSLMKSNLRKFAPSFSQYQIRQLQEKIDELEATNTTEQPKIAAEPNEVKELNERIKQLETQLYNTNKKAETAIAEKEALEKENDIQRQQLGSLREYIFNEQNNVKNNVDNDNKIIEFPFHSSNNISNVVCYGGHKSWLKNMREMLPDVTFVDAEVTPNPALFKGADAIWLQINKMGHNSYEIIMNIAKNYNIPVCYFPNSGAQKCAEAFVEHISA